MAAEVFFLFFVPNVWMKKVKIYFYKVFLDYLLPFRDVSALSFVTSHTLRRVKLP